MDAKTMNSINTLLNGHLEDYQIQQVNKVIDDFQEINQAVENYIIGVCPKCGQPHPVITKNGRANGGKGKQMFKCHTCGKSFVYDHGQLTYYSHQSQGKWNTLIEETLSGIGMRKTAINISSMNQLFFG